MAQTFTLNRVRRQPAADLVMVEAQAADGSPVRAELWWSALAPLTAAQRRAAIGQALAEACAAAPVDLGITGTITT